MEGGIYMNEIKKSFWKLDSIEIILYTIMSAFTAMMSPIIVVTTIFSLISDYDSKISPATAIVLIVLISQGLLLVYPNIKKSSKLTTSSETSWILNFIKLQSKTLLIQLLINIFIFVTASIFIFN